MTFDLGIFAQYGAIGAIAGLFIYFHFKHLNSSAEREKQLAADLKANSAECKIETAKLVERMQAADTRNHNAQTTLLQTCQETLRMNCQTFQQFSDHISGSRPAVDDPNKKTRSDRHTPVKDR